MSSGKLNRLQLPILGLIFMPLIFSFSAAKIDQMRLLPMSLPFQIQNARIFCFSVTLLSLLAIPFMNRYGIKDSEKLKEPRMNPETVLLLLDMALLLFPTMCVWFLFILGLPVNDVYFYSYPSFLAMLGWLFWKRRAFWFDDESSLRSNSPLSAIKSYTYVLCGLTILASLFLILRLILMINPPPEYKESFFISLPLAILYFIIGLICAFTIALRLRNSQHAFDVTAITSTLVAYWIPFGTVVYLYWRFGIKPKELLREINSN